MNGNKSNESEVLLNRPDIHVQWESDYLNPDMDLFYDNALEYVVKQLGIQPSAKLLDAGCGYCFHTIRVARGAYQITAVDFSDAAIKVGKENIAKSGYRNQIQIMKANIVELPFDDCSFDIVLSWGVIMHIPEMEKALLELARVLKPGGTLVLCENNHKSIDVVLWEPIVNMFKCLIRRSRSEHHRTFRGIEVWSQGEYGGLMIRKTNMNFLTDFLASNGLNQTKRVAGQFTEIYTNMPGRMMKRLVYFLNRLYFRYVRLPHPAVGNIIFFHKRTF